ncbi:hypothetical protein M3P36_08710 [Altererythrobacter sp. KTW20L]|uniref:hypothetical protein n=1 Tax=Altererythrobacter sp. KTW20L TaxID=2942210 RepID=UPI0020BE2D3B|nr:hypothetical protein [Altererythrobacter sp. KTW20L]MCL6251121.1 hypothetical protein [Altererythrobacter sp. KTW20L]
MAIDISQIIGPNAVSAHKAIKAAKSGDPSILAERLRDPAVALFEFERDWLANEILGENVKPAKRPKDPPDLKLAKAIRTYATFCKHMRLLADKGDRMRTCAINDTAKEIGCGARTVSDRVKYMEQKAFSSHRDAAKAMFMTDDEFDAYIAEINSDA